MSIKIEQKTITDFETLRDAVPSAAFHVVQLGRGNMTGTLTHLSGPVFRIATGSFSHGFRARGVQSGSEWTLSINTAPVVLQGFEVRPGDLFLLKPGQEIYASYPGANSFTAILIEQDALFAFLESQQPGASEAAIWQQPCSVVTIGVARAEAFRALLELIKEHGETMSAHAIAYYGRKLLAMLTGPVLDSIDRSPRLPLPASILVREVDRYLSESCERPVVSELCQRFKVPRRSLFNAFGDVLGVPPLTFQRQKRLCDVHEVLSQGTPDLLIKNVAIAHGLLELGKFSRDYRRLFNEKPSQTLLNAQRLRQGAGGFRSASGLLSAEMPVPLDTVIPPIGDQA
jgi:AraC family ethanolamine operon transcriptional activator